MLVTRNFPPLQGGMERLNCYLLVEASQCWDMSLCGPQGAELAAGNAQVYASPLRPIWRFLAGIAWNALRAARRERPEFVLAGSGLAAPMAWLAARATGARAGVYLHGLDVIVPSRVYQALWLPFIRRCDFVLTNSANTARLAAARGVPETSIHVLHPGVELPPEIAVLARDYRQEAGLATDARLLVSVGRLSPRKGLAEFVRHALPKIVAREPRTQLLMVGGEPTDALHRGGSRQRECIKRAAVESGMVAHLRFAGRCDDDTLAAIYRAADVHVFPVLDTPGDVEGFGMVAIEAAAHGLSTVAFAVGGVPEAISPQVSGQVVPSGDYAAFASCVLDALAAPMSMQRRRDCRSFAESFAWPAFGARLRALLADEVAKL